MLIIKLRLEHYKRLRLRHINVFEITPTALFQMIIGTNGSGKSSIMEEMSPLPADKTRYVAGQGKKTIWLKNKGLSYRLVSDFTEGNEHEFWVGEGDAAENLNKGRTVTVQKQLVLEHFKVTRAVHDLAMGKSRFSKMRREERREWMTELANASYDYALGVFAKAKKRERDTTGALTLLKKRLVVETSKILPEEDLTTLREDVVRYHDCIEFLMEHRIPPEGTVDGLMDQVYTHSAVLIETSQALAKKVRQINPQLPPQFDVLEELVVQKRAIIQACKTLADQYFQEHEKVQTTYEALEKTHAQSIAGLSTEIDQLETQRNELIASRKLKLELAEAPHNALSALNSSGEWITTVLESLPKNADLKYSRNSLTNLTTERDQLRVALQRNLDENVETVSKIQHFESLKSHGEIECPSCNHRFIKNYDAERHAFLKQAHEDYKVAIAAQQVLLNATEQSIQDIHQYFETYARYVSVTSQWPVLKPLWDHIQDSGNLLNNPTIVMSVLENYKQDLAIEVKAYDLARQVLDKLTLLKATQANAGTDFESVKRSKEALELRILENQRISSQATTEMNQLRRHIEELQDVVRLQTSLEALMLENESKSAKVLEAVRRESYQELIRRFQSMLARSDVALKEANAQAQIIQDVERQIGFCQQEVRCLQVIVQELSPTEGLIAEGLFGFMKLFIKQVNALIGKIWTYPLEVFPCELDGDQKVDLDYMFPMKVRDDEDRRKDIAEGSEGMREVVDLGFRITALKALGLGTYPIFLDEFGAAMDPTHKQATVQLVNSIMEQDNFSQLFMISHDTAQYGAIANSELCVLCDANVPIPKNCVYNRHVVML